jgi:hypothetical protein
MRACGGVSQTYRDALRLVEGHQVISTNVTIRHIENAAAWRGFRRADSVLWLVASWGRGRRRPGRPLVITPPG